MFLPDILKGIAVVLIIQVHVMELFAVRDILSSLAGRISLFLGGPPAAPVFMAVMGYLIAKSSKGFQSNIIRGMKLIIWGFLLNLGMNAHLLVKIIKGSIQLNPWPYIFGVDIFFLAGFSVLIIAVYKKLFHNQILPWLLLALFAAAARLFLPVYDGNQPWALYLQAFFTGNATWAYFPVFPWAAYPVLGFIFHVLAEKYSLSAFSNKGLLYIAGWLFIGVGVSFSYGFDIASDLSAYYHHDIRYLLWVTGFLGLWVMMIKLLSNHRETNMLFRYLRWAGKNVTSFYVIQWLLVGNLATYIYKTQHALALTFWFVTILASTSIMVFFWDRLKTWQNPSHLPG